MDKSVVSPFFLTHGVYKYVQLYTVEIPVLETEGALHSYAI